MRVGIMGCGRIGRNVFRLLADHPTLEVSAVVDTADPKGLAYLLKYDSIYGRFPGELTSTDGGVLLNGREIPFTQDREPGDADWEALGVDLVVQALPKYHTGDWMEAHLKRGAKRVVMASTPEILGDVPLLLWGVNDDILSQDSRVIALGSNTSNALAPILSILDRRFGIAQATFTSVHAFTNKQRLADVPTSGFRTSRAAAENIIPSETNSPAILEFVLPELAGKIRGMALNVPVSDGSTVDLVAVLETPTSVEGINEVVREEISSRYPKIIEYIEDPIVSSDVTGTTHSGQFDSLATLVLGETMAKLIVWFDNGWGYANRIVETLEVFEKFEEGSA
ncbi:MAG: aldehyde dehydrogenase [Acidimicrobiia bacterium]|nr:aldehyde dehydrogenase [Acidimicrobiia bacterium]